MPAEGRQFGGRVHVPEANSSVGGGDQLAAVRRKGHTPDPAGVPEPGALAQGFAVAEDDEVVFAPAGQQLAVGAVGDTSHGSRVPPAALARGLHDVLRLPVETL